MTKKRRQFKRHPQYREYRKLFVLSVEGKITEPEYFDMFNSDDFVVSIKCLNRRANQSSPKQVLDKMKEHLKRNELRAGDQAWLVVDKDSWTDPQLRELFEWTKLSDKYGLAVSNPKFELWLLWHFEDSDNIGQLQKHLPGYEKSIDVRKLDREMIEKAIQRAEKRDNPPCSDWPKQVGSTVYRLVRKFV